MITLLKELLSQYDEISAYEIDEVETNERQLYYVFKALETNRAVKTIDRHVTIYVDFETFRGSSTFTVIASDDKTSLKHKIETTIEKAKKVRNAHYPLPQNQKPVNEVIELKEDLNTTALRIADAIFAADYCKEGQLNATEIFVKKESHHFISSNNFEHHYDTMSLEFETIPSWSNEKEEVELYDYVHLGKLDEKYITDFINEALSFAKKRSEAVNADSLDIPAGIPVVVQGDMNTTIIDSLLSDFGFANKFMHSNHYELDAVVSNTNFDIEAKGEIEGVANSSPVDGRGRLLESTTIIKDGKLVNNWGGDRFAFYLDKQPTGNYECFEIDAKDNYVDLEKTPHLLVCKFSAPQLEAASGYFGGEVRLGLYFDGTTYSPITGFSIIGNIYESLKTVKFAGPTITDTNYKGPKYFVFENITLN